MTPIAGLLRTTMLRDEPLDFIILGTVDTALWLALLRACGGIADATRPTPRFPRSIGFALDAAAAQLDAIRSRAQIELPGRRAQQRLLELHTWLAGCGPEQSIDGDIHEVLTRVVDEVHAICAEVAIEFLGHR